MKNDDKDSQLFRASIGTVAPLKHDKLHFTAPKPKLSLIKRKIIQKLEAEKVLILEKDFSHSSYSLVDGDTPLWFARPGVQEKQLNQLKKGLLPAEAECDLHRLTQEQASHCLEQFIQESLQRECRVLRIIHGKGHRSGKDGPLLKRLVNQSLRELSAVLAFCSAPHGQGGTGAVLVLLKASKESL